MVEEELEGPLRPLREIDAFLSQVSASIFKCLLVLQTSFTAPVFPVLEGMGAPFSLLSAVSPTACLPPQACFSHILLGLCCVAT